MSDSASDWHARHDDCDHGIYGPYTVETCKDERRQAAIKASDSAFDNVNKGTGILAEADQNIADDIDQEVFEKTPLPCWYF